MTTRDKTRTGTTHIITCMPKGDSLRANTRPGDVVIDASMDQHTLDCPPCDGAVLVSLDTNEPAHMERALKAYLRWLTSASERMPSALAYDEALSPWWFLPFTMHHYRLTKLPQMIQQGLWWLDHGRSHHASAALLNADRVVIWGETAALTEVSERFLRAAFNELGRVDHVEANGVPRRFEHATLRKRLSALSRPQLGAANLALALSRHALKQNPISGRVDVLIATQLDDWMQGDDGKYVHRYLGDTVGRLGRLGLRVAWYPNVLRRSDLEAMERVFQDVDEPVAWLASEPGPARRAAMGGRVMRVWRRWVRLRQQISGGDFMMEGVDLSGFVLDQGDRIIPRMSAIADRYERVRVAIRRLKPAAVLVRNEFWSVSHPVCAAATRQSPVYGYQHGSIQDNHWLYRRSGALVRPAGALPVADKLPSPDQMLVYGRYERELMTKTGYPDGSIKEIGSLRHDTWLDRARELRPSDRAAMRKVQGFPVKKAGRLVVAMCGQLPYLVPRWTTHLIEGARMANVEVFLVFRSHWKYPSAELAQQVVDELGHQGGFAVDDGELFELLASCDVMLTGSSTTVVEAAALGTPAITCGFAGKRVMGNYESEGLAPVVACSDEMAVALKAFVAPGYEKAWEPRRRRYLDTFLVNTGRPAVDALAELIF